MKTLIALCLVLAPLPSLAAPYCGAFQDNGDSFQIIDRRLNAYGDVETQDPNGVADQLYGRQMQGQCVCVEGTVARFDRAGERAYRFTRITAARRCRRGPK